MIRVSDSRKNQTVPAGKIGTGHFDQKVASGYGAMQQTGVTS